MARSLPIAAAAVVAAKKTGCTVHYQLSRNEDFRMNGGLHPRLTFLAWLLWQILHAITLHMLLTSELEDCPFQGPQSSTQHNCDKLSPSI